MNNRSEPINVNVNGSLQMPSITTKTLNGIFDPYNAPITMKHSMKIKSNLHSIIDYLFVIFLIFAPAIFHLKPLPALCAFALAAMHLALTICTNYKFGILRVISFKTHGWIELGVSLTLIGIAFYFGNTEGNLAKNFYLSVGCAVFLTWLATDYASPFEPARP